jgi:hypothetical protein
VLRILIDWDKGHAYEKLSADGENLEYMRKHVNDKYEVVQSDCTLTKLDPWASLCLLL